MIFLDLELFAPNDSRDRFEHLIRLEWLCDEGAEPKG
jgi:hypothetical protein